MTPARVQLLQAYSPTPECVCCTWCRTTAGPFEVDHIEGGHGQGNAHRRELAARGTKIHYEQTCSETPDMSGLRLRLHQRQAESGRFVAQGGEFPLPGSLFIVLGTQIAKRGAVGEQTIDNACDFMGGGHNG
jgi:hypothetical protein